MTALQKDAMYWDRILDRLHRSTAYDAVRLEDIRRKHAAGPETNFEWQDIAANDAGVPRFGPI